MGETYLSLAHFIWRVICPEAVSALARRKGLRNDRMSECARMRGVTVEGVIRSSRVR